MAHKVKIIEKILEVLQAQAETTATLIDTLTSDYATSYRKARSGRSIHFKTDWAAEYRESQRFYSLLNHLKHDGLIKKEKAGRSSIWHITKDGLAKLRLSRREKYRGREAGETERSDDAWKIVIFDVPEKERHKRAWLRFVLLGMGFVMRQKSVWVGKRKIPQEFLDDLKDKRMIGCVDIFGVTRSGTLKDLLK